MNYSLASLAVELLLFAAAWLAVGLSIRDHRKTCLSWAWGWLMIGVAAILMFARPTSSLLNMEVPINFLLLTAFLQIQVGLGHFAKRPPHVAYVVLTYVGLMAIEVARWLVPGNESLLAWIFAATLAIPVSGSVTLLWSEAPEWFRRHRITQVLLVFPTILTVLVLVVRAILMTGHHNPEQFVFASTSGFIIVATTAFQVCLGFFNFSLFALVLGSIIGRLDQLTSQDPLTGLDNRRVMLERMAQAHTRFLKTGTPYAVVMMDLDQFKRVNDLYGHLAGDKTLRTIARRLRSAMRSQDAISRFGGDDFVLLLPDTELADACKQAEVLRAAVSDGPISSSRGAVLVTMSMGVTLARDTDSDAAATLVRADTALHQARNQGRNCLRVA